MAWLRDHQIDFTYRDLLKNPLQPQEIKHLASLLEREVRGLVNPKSQVFKKMGVNLETMGEKEIIQLINSNPRILTRPVLEVGSRGISGFEAGEYEQLFSKKG